MQQPELYLKREEGESWLDAYEKALLEDKKFFTSKPIIEKLFVSRLDKLKLREQAFRLLDPENGREESTKSVGSKAFDTKFQASGLKEAFAQYNQFKMQWQLQVFQAQAGLELENIVQAGIRVHKEWLEGLHIPTGFHQKDTLLSKAPDPSVLQEALNAFDKLGGQNVKDLENLNFPQKETLLGELKRLSLQLEKEK